MNRFAIVFGDNDFYNTFVPLVEALGKAAWEEITKEQLCEIANNLLYGYYLLHQNRFRYTNGNETNLKDTYLKIRPQDILFNEEMDAVVADWQNGEVFYWDGYEANSV